MMRKVSKKLIFSFVATTLLSAKVFANEIVTLEKKAQKETIITSANNGLSLGAVLPQGVFRTTVGSKFARMNSKFDEKGKNKNLGYTLNLVGMGFGLEYGATSKLSFGFKIPVILRNHLAFDPAAYEETDDYQTKKEAAYLKLSSISDETKKKIIFSNGLKKTFDSMIDGVSGLGDIEVGARYNWFSNHNFLFTTGLGFRLPTGKYYASEYLRPRGSGLFEMILENTGTFFFLEEKMALSLQHKGEVALTKAINPNLKNDSDDILAIPEAKENKNYYTKKGVKHLVTLQYALSFDAFTDHLKFLSSSLSYSYESDPYISREGGKSTPRSHLHSMSFSGSASLLPYKIPLSVDVDYTKPFAGHNAYDTQSLTFQLKGYLKF